MKDRSNENGTFGFFFKTLRWARKQSKIDPFRFWMVLSLFGVAILGVGSGVLTHYEQRNEYISVSSLNPVTLAEFQSYLDKKEIEEVVQHVANDGTLISPSTTRLTEIVLRDGTRKVLNSSNLANETVQKSLYEKALSDQIKFSDGLKHGGKQNRVADFLFFFLYIAAFVVLFLMIQRAASDLLVGKNFNPKTADPDMDFDDIVGYEEVKREMREVLEQLKNSSAFSAKGMSPPKGILLTGAPGVGKTMFAKAMANEFDAKFLYATGSDFVEMYVGVGARRARAIFQEARMSAPAIIFIDEIDALGARDSYGMDSERLSTINQMLAEMDGLNENKQILVIGATNHPDKLDSALLRPGRFDKKINIPNPDLSTRKGILEKYLAGVDVAEDVDLNALARQTPGHSGAELKNLVAEAKNIAHRRNPNTTKVFVDKAAFDEAHEVVLLGHSIREPSTRERELVAVHELGHALVAHVLCPHLEVGKVVVGGRGAALGFTLQLPIEEKLLYTKTELEGQISALLAGRAAEEVFFGDVSNGASDDLVKAYHLAVRMVCEYGMRGSLSIHKAQNPSGGWAFPQEIQEKIDALLSERIEAARTIIRERGEWMRRNKDLLLDKGTLFKEELFSEN